MIRLFLGIPIPSDIVDYLNTHIRQDNSEALAGLRFSRSGNHHLTLRFIGHVPETKTNEIIEQANETALNCHQFSLHIESIKRFPNDNSRIIAAYVELTTSLQQLQNRCESAMVKIGCIPEKKPFVPHITLGRSKAVAQATFNNILLPKTECNIECFHLYQSHLLPDGSLYDIKKTFFLAK